MLKGEDENILESFDNKLSLTNVSSSGADIEEIQKLSIDGVEYTVLKKKTRKRNKKKPTQLTATKFSENFLKQDEEIRALEIKYKNNFRIVDENQRKYLIIFDVRGSPLFEFNFSYPALYPSEVPASYSFDAPWMPDAKKKELKEILFNIFKERFGQCQVFYWAENIVEFLKKHGNDFLNGIKTEEDKDELNKNINTESTKLNESTEKCKEETLVPNITEGSVIHDRGSFFTPYLAEVKSENDVRLVIDTIESRRKVATAFRNTYAYRFIDQDDKQHEFGEDGGEPKAGRNLLQRLVNYNANNLIVFISRRIGGSLLGPDRYKHLNNAADEVLVSCGYKNLNYFSDATKTAKNKIKNKKKK